VPSPETRPFAPWLADDGDPPSKRAILATALRLFARHGLEGTSIRMIAGDAGYTNPALFKFFASKDALALHLLERCNERLYQRLAPATAGGFGVALDRLIDAFVELVDEDLEAVLFVHDSLCELWPRLPERARCHSVPNLLSELVGRGIREGAVVGFRSADVPVAALTGVLARVAQMIHAGEIEGPADRHRDGLRLALTRMLTT